MNDVTWFDTDGAPSTTWTTGQTHGVLRAEPHTDYFVDPRAIDPPTASAPLLLTTPGHGPFQFTAALRIHNESAYDAIALFVYDSPRTWGKFAIERSPGGQDLLTTVITRGVSDDANGPAVDTTHDVCCESRAYAGRMPSTTPSTKVKHGPCGDCSPSATAHTTAWASPSSHPPATV